MSKFIVKENVEFKDVNTATHYLELTEGINAGIAFTFGKVEFLGEDEDGNGKINFDYNLLNVPEHINIEEQREKIEYDIGRVLQSILEENLERGDFDNETGNDDSEQSDEGRDLSEEDDTVSEG